MMKNVIFTDHTNLNLNRFINDIRRYKPLSSDEEQQLIRAAQAGDKQAEDTLVKHNGAFLITAAKRYLTPYTDIEDLINSGAIGLMQAIYVTDTTRGNKLITVALPYMKKEMMRHLAIDKLVYIPDNEVRKVYRDEDEMYGVLHYNDEDTDPNWEKDIVGNHYNLDDHEPSAEEIFECLHSLSTKSIEIFRLLHGIEDGFEHAPESVADTYHCSRERIRQIDKQSIAHLKKHFYGSPAA